MNSNPYTAGRRPIWLADEEIDVLMDFIGEVLENLDMVAVEKYEVDALTNVYNQLNDYQRNGGN